MLLRKYIRLFMFVLCTMFVIFLFLEFSYAEPGSDPLTAEQIEFGKEYSGSAFAEDETIYHYYKFKTLPEGGIDYKLRVVNTDSGDYFMVGVFDSDYNDYSPVDGYGGDFTVYNNQGITKVYEMDPDEVYYIRFEANNIWFKNMVYNFRIDKVVRKPEQGSIYYIKGGKKKVTVKYHEKDFATEYQYRIKKGYGNWSKAKSCGAKLSKTITKLKSKSKYSVQVRACREFEGKMYYGDWSKKKTVKVK